jgi:FkbM family methyltransferase
MDIRSVGHRIDRLAPAVGVRLRLLDKRRRHDMTLSLIRRLVSPGDEVLDIGAYRGVYTLELSTRVGADGRVWAVEPFPPNAAAVERVTARRTNVVICPWAASDHGGSERLTVPVFGGRDLGALATLGRSAETTHTVDVDVRTVDGMLARDGGTTRRVTFVRCDVVGHEAAVLAGAAHTLRTHQPALLVEIEQRHQPTPIRDTFDMLGSHGYQGYFIRRDSLVPLAMFDLQRDQLSLVPDGFVPYGMPADYVHYFLFVHPATASAGRVRTG